MKEDTSKSSQSKENTELKKVGLKATLPRIRILEVLESSENRHLSAEDIYKQLITSGEDVGLATVYRVLTQFESAGIVMRHNFEEGHAVYEITLMITMIIWCVWKLVRSLSFMTR